MKNWFRQPRCQFQFQVIYLKDSNYIYHCKSLSFCQRPRRVLYLLQLITYRFDSYSKPSIVIWIVYQYLALEIGMREQDTQELAKGELEQINPS